MFESSAGEPSQPVSYELYDNLLDTVMKRLALCVIILVATSCTRAVPPPPRPKEPWVVTGETRVIPEWKALGLTGMSVRLEGR